MTTTNATATAKKSKATPKAQEATAMLRADHKSVEALFKEYEKALIAQVKDVEPDGEMFDAKIKVLSEYVKHHVKEEQNEMFPKAKRQSWT